MLTTTVSKQIKELDNNQYILVQVDLDVISVYDYIGTKQEEREFSYLFVKLDKSGADYVEVYGSNSCNIYDYATRIF